jgi:hypothetical protein
MVQEGNFVADLFTSCCCACCSIIQQDKEAAVREKELGQKANGNVGYTKTQTMSYGA